MPENGGRLTRTPPEFALSRLTKSMYVTFLANAAAKGYSYVQFRDFLPGRSLPPRYVALRHDVDFAPRYSLEMAEHERAAGVRSTYFVLTDGQFYDVAARTTIQALRSIEALGHEIGLHFAVSSALDDDIGKEVAFRMRLLSDIVGVQVVSFSQHDPVNAGFASVTLPAGCGPCVNAYQVVKAHDLLYVSDSAKMWRQYTFASALETDRNLCLLAHPHSWLQGEDDYIAMIRQFQSERVDQVSEPFDAFVDALVGYYQRRLREGI